MFIKPFFKKVFLILLIVIILMCLVFIVINVSQNKSTIISTDKTDWNTYVNQEYNFSISYPKNWKIYEDLNKDVPVINIYKNKFKSNPPYNHFSDITNVSIFPKGIGTEGIVGVSTETNLKIDLPIEKGIDYLTKEGEIWGRFIILKEPPKTWEPYGFIWIKNELEDPVYFCTRESEVIPIENCNTFGGDLFQVSGSLDKNNFEIQEKIIKSFKFID